MSREVAGSHATRNKTTLVLARMARSHPVVFPFSPPLLTDARRIYNQLLPFSARPVSCRSRVQIHGLIV